MRTVHELNEDEFYELRQTYYDDRGCRKYFHSSRIPIDEIKKHYEGVTFVDDDFFCNINKRVEKVGVYVNGNAQTPERFWSYALVTNINEAGSPVKNNYTFCQKNTDLYNSLTEDEKNKLKFMFVDGVKQF